MSDIFSGLGGGIKFPDVQMNVGPLPNTSGGPAGSDGTADGRYNFNSDLLSGVEPYAFGSSARMGSDRNYQQIPHRVQKIIPLLYLPYADDNVNDCLMPISHAVDQGDIAFAINSERTLSLLYDKNSMHDPSIYLRQTPAWTAFCNIVTVNYILAGLQRINPNGSQKKGAWAQLANDLCYDWRKNGTDGKFAELQKLMQTRLLPFGICAGSENQGGLHETGLAPVQAAANHVTTMTVDGQNRDLVNYWRVHDLSAGDQLIMRLEYVPTSEYTLNHYYKQMATQRFSKEKMCWQLVCDRYSISYDPCLDLSQRHPAIKDPDTPCYDYRLDGYWRIGQLFQHRGKHDASVKNFSDDMVFLRGQLLQITFAPVWLRMCHASRGGDQSKYNKDNTDKKDKKDKSSRARFYGHGKSGKRPRDELFDTTREDLLRGRQKHKQSRHSRNGRSSDTDDSDSGGGGGGYGGGGGGGRGYGGGQGGRATPHKKYDGASAKSITYSEWLPKFTDVKTNMLQTFELLKTSEYYDVYDEVRSANKSQVVGNFAREVIRKSKSFPDDFSEYYTKSANEAGIKKKVLGVKGEYWILEENLADPILKIHDNLTKPDGLLQKFNENGNMASVNRSQTVQFLESYKRPSGMDKEQEALYHADLKLVEEITGFEFTYAVVFAEAAKLLKDTQFIQTDLEILIKEWIETHEAGESGVLSSHIDKQPSGLKKKLLTLVGDKDKHAVQASNSKDSAEPAPKKVKVVKKMIKGKGDVEMDLGGNATDNKSTK